MKTYSETKPIGALFEKSAFTIPEIQRDYAWDAKKEVSKLLEDLWKYHKVTDHKTSPQYFIGTVIVYSGAEHDKALQIMDGQQRITSITSLMAAIKTHIESEFPRVNQKRKKEFRDLVEEIEDTFLFDIVKKSAVPKLRPKSIDTEKTIRIMIQMDGKDPREKFKDESSEITKGKLYLALDWFHNRLYELAHEANPDDYISELIKFYRTVTEKIVVTLTTTTTMGMAFQMFVSVNGAGKPLNSFDLLRGLLVAKSHAIGIDKEVGKEIRLLSKDMKAIEKKQGGDSKVQTCMRYWTEARHGKNIQDSSVPDELDFEIREFLEYSQFENMIRELRRFSTWFLKLNTERFFTRPGYMQHRRILGFSDKGSSSWNANHMVLYISLNAQGRSPSEIDAVMNAVEWVSIRGGWSQISNSLENIYPEYSRKALYEDKVDDWYDEFIDSLNGVLEKVDINGFSHLEKEPVSESKATVLLHKVRKSSKDPGPQTKTKNCNGCRCMPEGAPSPWKCNPERNERGKISGLLGNWFLMRDITDKEINQFQVTPSGRIKQMISKANTGIEVATLEQIKRKLDKNDEHWKTQDIRQRNKELLQLVENAWPKEFVRPKL